MKFKMSEESGFSGRCPRCGKNDGIMHLETAQFFICHEHRMKWFAGVNIATIIRHGDATEWEANYETLREYQPVEPLPTGKEPPKAEDLVEDERGWTRADYMAEQERRFGRALGWLNTAGLYLDDVIRQEGGNHAYKREIRGLKKAKDSISKMEDAVRRKANELGVDISWVDGSVVE